MEEHEAALAKAVAETADAWLRDPRDAALYVRLLTAIEAWRAGSGGTSPARSEFQHASGEPEQGDTDPSDTPATLSTGTAALIEKLRRIQGEARQRERERPASPKGPSETARDEPGDTGATSSR